MVTYTVHMEPCHVKQERQQHTQPFTSHHASDGARHLANLFNTFHPTTRRQSNGVLLDSTAYSFFNNQNWVFRRRSDPDKEGLVML